MSPNLRSLDQPAVSVWCRKGDGSVRPSVTLQYGEGGVMCRGALLVTLKARWSVMATTAAMSQPIWCVFGWTSIHYSMTPMTPLCEGDLSKKESEECCFRWPGLHSHPTWTQARWSAVRWTVKAEGSTSAQSRWELLQDCWKTVSGDSPWKLMERLTRVCKAFIKERLFWRI